MHLTKPYLGLLIAWLLATSSAFANIPGGGTGTGANVTLTSTSTTATLSNGVVSILCTKAGATINQINYTFNNNGSSQTLNLLSGGNNGGMMYWEHSNNQGLVFTYSVVVDPASNGGDYAEIALYSTTQANMPFEVHYAMRRGSPGYYVAAIWTHNSSNGAFSMGECRSNIYAGSIFNWMSVDATRNKLMQVSGGTSVGVSTAPVECSLWTNGIYQGRYEDKYKYSANLGDQRVWGWSSVTANGMTGKNVGLWNVSATSEYYNGGPLHPELMCHIGTTILNMLNGNHYGMGTDGDFVAGETWSKVCGPYFVYCNNIPSSITDPVQASQALYNDALAQGVAEKSAWPYSWFSHANYAGPANRGTVTGKIVINDSYNPNATASNLWVGLIRQPVSSTGKYDFQQWMKPYQFWVHTDADGNFTVPAVIAGSNYTLYAFGQGTPGTFMSQAQTGGSPAVLEDISATPFAVTVTGGATTALGNVTWTPTRVGPTVFEIGYPDRTARKFKHGEDWWVGDIGPSPTAPSPVWSKWLEYPFDFPSGPSYTVGSSRWTTDWNFCQPVVQDSAGNWNASTSTITFNLASAPATGNQGSLYLGLSSDYYGPIIVSVNDSNLGSTSGVTSTPSSNNINGYFPSYSSSDTTVREGSNAMFSDERITFPGTLLKAGSNTIKINMRKGGYFANHAMYDYLRLELTNYVPPAPASVTAFAGNNRTLVSWPTVPGATSYQVLRSTVNGSGYSTLATGVIGPVSGSGPTNTTYVDSTALNGTTYYYVVQSTNPVSSSANSAQSTGVTPSSSAPSSAPAGPTGLTATAGSGAVSLNWTASSGANLYTVKRSTLTFNGGGSTIPLNTITLTNSVTGTSYTDTSPTNGSLYSYSVSATNTVGSSGDSTAASTTPVAVTPATGPASFTATPGTQKVTLNWSAVTGATGYLLQVATTPGGPYTYVTSISSLSYTDGSQADNTTYYYVVAAINSGGISSNSAEVSATTAPAAPIGFAATAGSTQVALSWTATTAATSYRIQRGTATGGPYTTVGTSSGTSSIDNGLTNGTAYYYVVNAVNANGTSVNSAELKVTPSSITLTTAAGRQQIALNWTASVGATGYAILRGATSGGPYTSVVNSITLTTYTNTGLTNGIAYYYIVAATAADGSITYSNEANATPSDTPRSITWKGLSSTAWDTTTGNWLVAGNTATTYADADSVTFDDTGDATSAVSLVANVQPGAVIVNATKNYTLSGSGAITGTSTLTKSGSGTLTLSNPANTVGLVVREGILRGGGTTANTNGGFGTGTIELQGGTLNSAMSSSNTLSFTNALTIATGQTGTFNTPERISWSGSVTGDGTLNVGVATSVSRFDFNNNLTGFTGNLNLSGSGGVRLYNNGGTFNINSFSNLELDLGGSVYFSPQTNSGGNTYPIGALSGSSSNASLSGGSAGTATYSIGSLNASTTFAGVISGNAALIKTGTGTLTLSGVNTYTGSTTVTAGKLSVTGSLGTTTVTIATAGTLGGTGTIAGVVTCNGTLAPGVAAGSLTFSSGLVLASTSKLEYDLGSTSDLTAVTGNLTLDGTVNITAASGFTAGTYTLISYTGTLTSNTLSVGSMPTGYSATVNIANAGQVNLVVTSNKTTPTVSLAPTASAITYGQSLSSSSLSGGTASVAGTFAFTNPGTTPNIGTSAQGVTFTPTDSTNYNTATTTATVTVNKADATVTLSNLTATYDGTAKSVTATTVPAGLGLSITYAGSASAPVDARYYPVVATIQDSRYQGSANDTLVIAKATATVTLGSLSATYDGTAKPATATTTPGGLTVNFTYDESPTAPTDAGTYSVVGTISSTNYTGSATGSLVITPPPRSYSAWVNEKFSSAQIAAGESDPTADPDHDSLKNLAEYALGGDPHAYTPQPAVTKNATSLSITFLRPAETNDVTYRAEVSPDFANWEALTLDILNSGSDPETVRATYTYPTPKPAKSFIRLRFEQ